MISRYCLELRVNEAGVTFLMKLTRYIYSYGTVRSGKKLIFFWIWNTVFSFNRAVRNKLYPNNFHWKDFNFFRSVLRVARVRDIGQAYSLFPQSCVLTDGAQRVTGPLMFIVAVVFQDFHNRHKAVWLAVSTSSVHTSICRTTCTLWFNNKIHRH
jgi:cytochrome c oxidase assembly factor CtaG